MDLVVDELPALHERIKNQLPFFGDDMMSSHAIYYTPDGFVRHPTWMEAQWLMARAGWRSRSNAVDQEGMEIAISAFERINKEVDITGLRWTLHRMSGAASEQLKAESRGRECKCVCKIFPACSNADAPYGTIPHCRGQWNPRWDTHGWRTYCDAKPVVCDLLRGDWTQCAGRDG
jgi:hypothetical protein